MTANPPLILASGSRYRRELLGRLQTEFSVEPADIDESPVAGESPEALAQRLATGKASVVTRRNPAALVIGSDQVAALGDRVLGKPGNHANAARQLAACSGKEVTFYTAVALLRDAPAHTDTHLDRTLVRFRTLTAGEIDRYLELEQPWDCAGSFRSEGLGVTLFESMTTDDPTGLIGLPLIWLAGALRRAGLDPLRN